jgi:hypothetical protein
MEKHLVGENKLFKLLLKIIPDLKNLDEFNPKDFYSQESDCYFEIKTRTRHFDTIGIEKVKWNHLRQFKRSRFVVMTPKGIWSWNVNRIKEPVWEKRIGPTSTYFSHQTEITHVEKQIGYLNFKDAKDLSYLLSD